MSAKTGEWSSDDSWKKRSVQSPDLPELEYREDTDTCKVANLTLLSYVTKPYQRSIDKNGRPTDDVCRLTNFIIGDDVAYATLKVDGVERQIMTDRHSRTYCSGFDKQFDPAIQTCRESIWDQLLSYTFVGTALLQLARHAVAGGDRCDGKLSTDPTRVEIDPRRTNETSRSRRAWINDVDRSWCLPPPNVLLSDLGVFELGQVWVNDDAGGRVVATDAALDYDSKTGEHRIASRLIKRNVVSRRSDDRFDSWFSGYTTDDNKLLNFDDVNSDAVGSTDKDSKRDGDDDDENERYRTVKTGSEKSKELLESLGITVASVATFIKVTAITNKLVKSAFNRAIRFVGRDLSGYTSRTMLALGLRVCTANMIGYAFSRLSTRVMLALSTTASGVGFAIGVLELIGALLDFMLLFGWDPGNYNSEFDNIRFTTI